ncbi:hypothetical protein [Nonlabens xiamenensis]|uniref:hypothetical protein n=1 Tax=Nonlabens xiamenensis TaxID=2341043 RepID=UPI000F60DB16|nr:hypothetical protein [Nonlabens xiamenensis]
MRKLKLIWDFKGPAARPTAEHHLVHLNEFLEIESIDSLACGVEQLHDNHWIAFVALNEEFMPLVRDRLKPHRGQLWS